MAKPENHHAVFLAQDRLVNCPARVQVRQQVRHCEAQPLLQAEPELETGDWQIREKLGSRQARPGLAGCSCPCSQCVQYTIGRLL